MHESDKKTLHRITKQASKITKTVPLMICIIKLSQRKLNVLCQTSFVPNSNHVFNCNMY